MRIKKLEIFGFKSFATRQSINFGRGVTGIVGPNGCGKSNVVDALRWVMGEQNARHLRGGNMQDIIFCGSEKKAPLGFAEVILTLDNDDQDAPLEYNHFQEIQISRRLYKTGDSEYEINRQKVRLRDVSDFFLGTGVGTKAYSIIEQGRVNDIVSAKPGDRRLIIEEAAGITKYKSKKAAAERRMEATRGNLDRIIDIKNDVDKRVALLVKEKEKLEKLRALKKNIKQIDLHIASHQYLALSAKLSYINSHSLRLNAEILDSERSIAAREQVFGRVLDEYSRKHDQKRLLDTLETQHKNTLELLKKDLEYTNKTLKDNQGLITRTESQLDDIEKRSLEISIDIEHLQTEHLSFEKQCVVVNEELELKKSSGQAVVEKRQAIINNERVLQKKLMESATDAARLQAQIHSTREQEAQKKLDLKHLDNELNLKSQDLANSQVRIDALSEELSLGLLKKQSFDESLDVLKKRLKEERDLEREKALSLRVLEDEKMSLSSRLRSLKEIDESCEWSASGLTDLLASDSKRLIRGIVADHIRVKHGHEETVEKCLAHLLDAAIIEDQEALKEISSVLQKKKAAQTSFLVLSNSESHVSLAKPIGLVSLSELITASDNDSANLMIQLSRFFIADTLALALKHWPAARMAQATIFSLEGELLLPDGRAHVLGQNNQGVLKRKNEVVELEKKIAILISNVDNDKKTFLLQEQKIIAEEQERDRLLRELQPLNFALVRLEETLKQKKLEQEKAIAEINRLKEKSLNLNQNAHSADERVNELSQKWSLAMVVHKESEEALELIKDAMISAEVAYEQHIEATKHIEIKRASFREKLQNLVDNLKNAQKNLDHITAQKQMLTEQMSEKTADEIRLNESERQIEKKIASLSKEIEETSRLLVGLNAECVILAQKKLAEELLLAQLQADERKLREGLYSHEITRNNAQNEIDLLCDRINERYRLKLIEELHDFHLCPLDEHLKRKEMEELKRAVDRMGFVNENALQEYEELNARSTFLKIQVDDLNDALNQLESAIKKINKTTKMRFLEAFNCINQQFSQVFPRLFNGGKAELILLDEDDLLSSGIDIMAKPPGKNVSSIDLMSGGEKALTAISLIMAIFLIKPSPFCLLDEVDAPLDEANVSRFSQLVKEMSALSQFIVITHNRKTMESADQLYGVTMEDAGMSKIVSVHVQQAFDALKQTDDKALKKKPTQLFLGDVIE